MKDQVSVRTWHRMANVASVTRGDLHLYAAFAFCRKRGWRLAMRDNTDPGNLAIYQAIITPTIALVCHRNPTEAVWRAIVEALEQEAQK